VFLAEWPSLQQRMPAVWWTMNQTADFVAKKSGIAREAPYPFPLFAAAG
jgi:hypothetical protein